MLIALCLFSVKIENHISSKISSTFNLSISSEYQNMFPFDLYLNNGNIFWYPDEIDKLKVDEILLDIWFSILTENKHKAISIYN